MNLINIVYLICGLVVGMWVSTLLSCLGQQRATRLKTVLAAADQDLALIRYFRMYPNATKAEIVDGTNENRCSD